MSKKTMPSLFGDAPRGGKKRSRRERHEDYEGFVDKFRPKLTTDDCLTPPEVYAAIIAWVSANVRDLDGVEVVRPFWPGGDYERHDYPPGCVVIDNPPFSKLAKIRHFYTARGINYFLFAPALTLFASEASPGETFIVAPIHFHNHNESIKSSASALDRKRSTTPLKDSKSPLISGTTSRGKSIIHCRKSGSSSSSVHGMSTRSFPRRDFAPSTHSSSGKSKKKTESHCASLAGRVRA